MPDNDIIKAWEKIMETGDAPIGERWSVGAVVTTKLAKETLDMLNRQKTEIEWLKEENFGLGVERDAAMECMDTAVTEAKSEAIREFAERLKRVISISVPQKPYFDDLVIEMVGDE